MWAVAQHLGSPRNRRHDPSYVDILLPVRDSRKRDPHNYYPTVKQIVDGLVKAKVWPDDNSEWVTTREPVLSPTASLVVVTITPREEP